MLKVLSPFSRAVFESNTQLPIKKKRKKKFPWTLHKKKISKSSCQIFQKQEEEVAAKYFKKIAA